MKPVIYLDLDGVCCNFARGACEAHQRDYDDIIKNWPKGTYDMGTVLGMSKTEFWKEIDIIGARFWRDLEAYPYFHELYGLLVGLAVEFDAEEVHFCTTPSDHPSCAAGKIAWLQDRFGPTFNKFILVHDKHILARPGAVLIDDSQHKCKAFIQSGNHYGQGAGVVMVPHIHNESEPVQPEDMVEHIVKNTRLWLEQFTAEVK